MKASSFPEGPVRGTMAHMAVAVLFVALALVAVGLVLTAIRIASGRPGRARSAAAAESDRRSRRDGEVTEIRRGDRPKAPAEPIESGPDNLSPFFKSDSEDERR